MGEAGGDTPAAPNCQPSGVPLASQTARGPTRIVSLPRAELLGSRLLGQPGPHYFSNRRFPFVRFMFPGRGTKERGEEEYQNAA